MTTWDEIINEIEAGVAEQVKKTHYWYLGMATIGGLRVQTVQCAACLAIVSVAKDLDTAIGWLDAVTGHKHTRPAEPEGTPGI